MIEQLNSKDFLEHLHTSFQAHVLETGTLLLELIEVSDYAANPRLEQFSLVFRGPSTPWFHQTTVKLEHPVLGSMELFIAPLGPDELGMKYQAIVNRFRK